MHKWLSDFRLYQGINKNPGGSDPMDYEKDIIICTIDQKVYVHLSKKMGLCVTAQIC